MGHGRSQEQGVVVDESKYQEPNDRVFPAVKEFKNQIGEALYLLLIIIDRMVDIHEHSHSPATPPAADEPVAPQMDTPIAVEITVWPTGPIDQ